MMVAVSGVAFAVTVGSMFAVLWFARRKGLYDSVGGRKIHTGNVPRLGGIAIFLGFAVAAAIGVVGFPAGSGSAAPLDLGRAATWYTLGGGAIILFGLGLCDDFNPIPAKMKLLVQILVAVAVTADGWCFRGIGIYPDALAYWPAWVSVILTAGWIVGVTNAMNLIDGVDGLAGGIALIAAAIFGAIHLELGNMIPALLSFALCGSLLGFLAHNFPFPGRKAKIFMGDSGSLFLGYVLAVLPLAVPVNATSAAKIPGLLVPFAVLAVPILDTLNAIRRRARAHVSFAVADKRHLHHILLGLGLSVRELLAALYTATILLGGISILSFRLAPVEGAIIILSALAILALSWILVYYRHDTSPASFIPGEASHARKVKPK